MQKKLLVAVDESFHAQNALLYAAGFYLPASDFQITLMHVQPTISQYLQDGAIKSSKIESALKQVQAENKTNSQKILENFRDVLIKEGIPSGCIETESRVRTMGLTKDIIEYGRSNGFDAIVAGRRGLSRIQKVFMGSTSAKLMEHADDIPLCIVDGQTRPNRMLVAVDLEAPSLPLIDHIGRMCAGMPHLHLTIFHAFDGIKIGDCAPFIPGAAEIDEMIEKYEREVIEKFWEKARRDLTNYGLTEQQIDMKTIRRRAIAGSKIGKRIIDEVQNNHYDTVVMGRTGSGNAYFFGSVSRYVSERLTGHSIWLIG
jgi:nucleotide-binding universal stress UspA family protein